MIAVENLTLRVGNFSLDQIGFSIDSGQYGILMGRTGCGKTTLLEAICGLRPVTSGAIRLNGHNVVSRKPAERNIGYVPQDRALFSTMTVRGHLAFSMRIRRAPTDVITQRVDEMADLLGIAGLLDRMPRGLSGGEAQRVALGRALASHPGILCLDEPLSAVDDATRYELYELLESIQDRTSVTILHVTHSREEARRLGDRLFVMEAGRIREVEPASIDR
ncbi:MAG: ABC transporter ATP-binding protein [Pirellulales bacterium]